MKLKSWNQNYIHEEIKSKLNLENPYCDSVQNILSSCHLSTKSIQNYNCLFFCMGVKVGILPKGEIQNEVL
jgi:hypothetical protein